MKITMDKDMTESYMIERTKTQMKEFKEIYTDNDLLRMFREAIKDAGLGGTNPEILRCNLRAFPGGYNETDETHYCVEMLLESWKEFTKVVFYITQSGDIDVERRWVNYGGHGEWMDMFTVEHYKLV